MARLNIKFLGISELKWTGMGKFNSDDHYIYYWGQEPLWRNGVFFIVDKRVQNAVLGCNLKNNRMTLVHFQGKPFNIIVIKVYATTTDAEEAELKWFYEDLQELLELISKKGVLFITGDWNTEVSRDTWSNRQVWHWSTKWSRAKTNRVLSRECTGHSKHFFPNNPKGDSIHGHHQKVNTKIRLITFFEGKMEKLYTVTKKRLELTVAQIMNSLLQILDLNWTK